MGFFDDVDIIEEEPDEDGWEQPAWWGPRPTMLAGLVADRRVLVRTGTTALVLDRIEVTDQGASLVLQVHVHRPPGMSHGDWRALRERADVYAGGGQRVTLHAGVRFPDGSKVTTLAAPAFPEGDGDPPDGPVLRLDQSSGSGESSHSVHEYVLWLWPLPPPEPLELVVAWPDLDLPETGCTLDGAAIVAAARDAVELFSV
jgi:hypothetical protein